MSFDLSSIQQKPNDWFSTSINYDGDGIAEFQDPKGNVWGHTYISFEEIGEPKIEMHVEGMNSEQKLPLGLLQLVSGDKPIESNGTLRLGFPPVRFNPCLKLSVKTINGEFISHNIQNLSLSSDSNVSPEGWNIISFHSSLPWFNANNTHPAKYWAIPLTNFISKFSIYDSQLAHHPLRIYPDTVIPNEISEEDRALANLISSQKSRLIVFEYNGDLGFIEKLPDYEERIEKLKNRQIPSAITAFLIGSIGTYSYEPIEELDKWFPHFLIELLELSVGNQLEFPWIEIRDAQGCLIRRIHKTIKPPLYMEGIKAIDEIYCKGGIGRLLTVAKHSPYINQSFLRVALRHTILGGRYEQTVEDKLDHLCRALDTLCEYFGFKIQDLLSISSNQDRKTILDEIHKVSSAIESISMTLLANGEFAQNRYLQTIIGRLTNVTNRDRKFGLALCDLLNKFGLPDANVIDAYFIKAPRKDGLKNWADVITHYRGCVIHTGYFDFRNNQYEIQEVWKVIQHLYDILLRLLLKIVDYDGEYLPTTIGYGISKPIDWVKPDTGIEWLGYKENKNITLMIVSSRSP